MDKEKKRMLKVLNTMMGDGSPTKIVKKTISRLMQTKDAVDMMVGSEEDPTVGAFLKETARLVYGLMDQIETLEGAVDRLDATVKFQREEIESLRSKIDSLEKK